jgi:hypothetical protein
VKELSGPISDRLRKKFDKDDPAWNPGRPESPKQESKIPKGVQGEKMTGRKR